MAAQIDPDSAELLSLELKNKKKKGRKKVNLDMTKLEDDAAALAGGLQSTTVTETVPNNEPVKDAVIDEDLQLNLGVKKKKKKKMPRIDDGDKALTTEQPRPLEPPEVVVPSAPPQVAQKPTESVMSYDYALPVRKRRRRQNITFEGFDEILVEEGVEVVKDDVMEGEEELADLTDTSSWAGSDRDYLYDELLERVFNIMRQKNPNMVDRKTKLVMKPPQVMRVGARRTSFANFTEICKLLHRQPKHLLAFLLAELGTNGSIDGNNQLIIKGRFQQKQIETVLRRYIKEYVTCHTCRSPDTTLQRENRLFFLQCGTCGSRCTVENVKSGFQAVTNRRAIRQQQ